MKFIPTRLALVLALAALASACTSFDQASNRVASVITPYQVEVVQGNFISAEQAAALQKGMTRPIHLYWGGRKREDIYMHELATQWAREHAHIHYTPVLSNATEACAWQGRQGFVHNAVIEDIANLAGHQIYACGAPLMVDAARRDFINLCGLPDDQFFADSFVSEADKARANTASADSTQPMETSNV